jgi:hypothetical protein
MFIIYKFIRWTIILSLSTEFWKIFKYKIAFPFSGSQVVPHIEIDIWMDGQTDMMKLIVAFHNFANAPKIKPDCHARKEKDGTIQ